MSRDRDDLRAQLEGGIDPAAGARSTRTAPARSRVGDDTGRRERPALDHWAPPSQIETPANDEQWVYRWIAEYVNGEYMPRRLGAARREGYEFVRVDELPEDFFFYDDDSKGDGLVRSGGLILARMPRKFAEQRRAHYASRSRDMLRGANILQGVAGRDAFEEDRGTRTLDGRAAGEVLRSMARGSA